MEITTVGLDLAKHVFQVHGADRQGKPQLSRQLRRGQDAIGAVGEILGASGVIVSLLYLSTQIRRSDRTARAEFAGRP